MSVTSHLEKAEEAIRQALINALAEGEDDYLTDLFDQLNSVRDLRKKVTNTIRFSDNTEDYYDKLTDPNSSYNFNLTSSYLDSDASKKSGKDLDHIDNVLDFPIKLGHINLQGGLSDDVITFGDDSPEKT
tara:strand:+ start:407 stop:796 length:390 start_codon:yes stop_codon:yes gene_type:complete